MLLRLSFDLGHLLVFLWLTFRHNFRYVKSYSLGSHGPPAPLWIRARLDKHKLSSKGTFCENVEKA